MILTVIIPVYNCEKYIVECLNSVCKKLNEKDLIEVIIINDGSTDNSLKKIQEFEEYSFVKIFNIKHKGVSCARNYGMRKSSGKFLMFVDADDTLVDDWANIILHTIKTNKNSYVISFNSNYKNEKIDLYIMIKKILGLCYENTSYATACSKIYNRSFLLNTGIKFDTSLTYGEDVIFNLDVVSNTKKFLIIGEYIYNYRYVSDSSSNCYRASTICSYNNYLDVLNKKLSSYNYEKGFVKEIYKTQCTFVSIILVGMILKKKDLLNKNVYLNLVYTMHKNDLIFIKNKFKLNVAAFLIKYRLFFLLSLIIYFKKFFCKKNGEFRKI